MGWGARTSEGRHHTRRTTVEVSRKTRAYGAPFVPRTKVTIGGTSYVVDDSGSLRRRGGVSIARSAAA